MSFSRAPILVSLLLATAALAADPAALMNAGREAILAKNYPLAIDNYAQVVATGESRYAADALEFLGVARQRNGDTAGAIEDYRRYLAAYPQNTGAGRVQQRLDALLLVLPREAAEPQPPPRGEEQRAGRWSAYGGVSQYYRGDRIDFGEQGSRTVQSAVLTDVDAIVRHRGGALDFEGRVTLGHYLDLLSEDEGPGNDTRVYYAYADVESDEYGLGARLGRQRANSSGVLSRFDGARVSYQFNPDWRVNVLAGEPVYSTSSSAESDRSFYGLSVDAFDLGDLFDMTVYLNVQDIDGIRDREAIGAEFTYYDERRMLVSYLDYDTGYSALNSFVVLGNWTFDNEVTVNASIDHRRTPYLTTENALFGQDASSIDELEEGLSESEIRTLAESSTGKLTTGVFGIAKPVTKHWQVNADVTVSDFKPAFDSTTIDTEYNYSMSLLGEGLFKKNDASIITLRYLDGSTTSTTSLIFDTRYPMSERLRLNPRFIYSQRDFSTLSGDQTTLMMAMRLFYRWRRHALFELELGGRWSDRDTGATSVSTDAWFIYAGYRYNF